MKKIILIKVILGLITPTLYAVSPLITSEKQIKKEVKEKIVTDSSAYQTLKSSVATNSTNIAALQSSVATNTSNIATLQSSVAANTTNISTIQSQLPNYVLKAGDTMSGTLQITNGNLIVSNLDNNPQVLIGDSSTYLQYGYLGWDSLNDYLRLDTDGTNGLKIKGNNVSIGNIYPYAPLIVGNGSTELLKVNSDGKTEIFGDVYANTFYGDGSHLTGINTSIYPYSTDYFKLGITDVYGRKELWFNDTNSVLRLGSAQSDGDPIDMDSEGIVVYAPSSNSMARIKPDRFGLTATSDSSLYYFRVDKNALYYKDGTLADIFRIDRATKKLTYKDGTEGAGKVLTSDANGVASWTTMASGSGDNLGNHIATTTLDMAENGITNISYIDFSSMANNVIVGQGVGIDTTTSFSNVILGNSATPQTITNSVVINANTNLSSSLDNTFLWGNVSSLFNLSQPYSNMVAFGSNLVAYNINDPQNIRVGIGIAIPSNTLDVNGSITAHGTIAANDIATDYLYTPSGILKITNGGFQIRDNLAKPNCDINTRGTFWFTQGVSGVSDSVEVCVKTVSDTYTWVSLI